MLKPGEKQRLGDRLNGGERVNVVTLGELDSRAPGFRFRYVHYVLRILDCKNDNGDLKSTELEQDDIITSTNLLGRRNIA